MRTPTKLRGPVSQPQLALWRSPDGSMEFAVEIVPPLPKGAPSLKQMELAYSAKGIKVTRRPIRKIGKHAVWTIETSNAEIKQLIAIVHHDEWLHRLRVLGLVATFDMDCAEAFMKSLAINAAEWKPPSENRPHKREGAFPGETQRQLRKWRLVLECGWNWWAEC